MVLIAGGGVAGMCAALALASHGYRSIVFESAPKVGGADRGDLLYPGSLTLLAAWGAESAISEVGALTFDHFRVADNDGRVVVDVRTRELLGEDYFFTSIAHRDLVTVLAKAAEATGLVELRLGAKVRSLCLDEGRVVGLRTVDGAYRSNLTIVANGGSSILRDRHFGVAQIYDYKVGFLNARVSRMMSSAGCAYYIVGRRGVMILEPLPGSSHRVGVQVPESELGDIGPEYFERAVRNRYTPCASTVLDYVSRPRFYALKRSIAQEWWIPGAALVGDAARRVHPVGGQGMNLAIGDAHVLAGSIEVQTMRNSDCIDRAVASYAKLRKAQVSRVVRRTHLLGVLASSENMRSLIPALVTTGHSKFLQRNLLQGMMRPNYL